MRNRRIVVRLHESEAARVLAIAEAEKLTPATFARRLLLTEADRRLRPDGKQIARPRKAGTAEAQP
jgi:hypothetical protein